MMWDLRSNRQSPPPMGMPVPSIGSAAPSRHGHAHAPSIYTSYPPPPNSAPPYHHSFPPNMDAAPSLHSGHQHHHSASQPHASPQGSRSVSYETAHVAEPRSISYDTAHAPPRTRPAARSVSYPQAQAPVANERGLMHHNAPPRRMVPTPARPPHPGFVYSKCNGRKRAVCIGINYTGQKHALRGCINDAESVRHNLIHHLGFPPDQVALLTDDARDPGNVPTRKNIFNAMRWLVQGARAHDSLFIHYSGHGGRTPDIDGDEIDGFDEVIYPIDFKQNGHIVDDEMHSIMVIPLPAGCRLTAVFDSCHSGTILDLPYMYSSHGRLKGSHVSRRARRRKATAADVISWSGCKDDGTSADTFVDGKAVGAMSHAFMTVLHNNPHQSYQQLLFNVRQMLRSDFKQKPQLGSSHPIDTHLEFVI